MGKQRRVELKSVGNFVAKIVLVESANQFSLEELCRTRYSMKYVFRSHVDHQTYGKFGWILAYVRPNNSQRLRIGSAILDWTLLSDLNFIVEFFFY